MPRTDSPLIHRIETERLELRPWQATDAPSVVEAISQSLDSLRQWMPWAQREPMPVQEKAQQLLKFRTEFEIGASQVYGMFDLATSQVLGSIGMHWRIGAGAGEIGYWVRSNAHNKGYATEAAAALVKTGIVLHKLRRIEIHCDPGNFASAAVPHKLGFSRFVVIKNCVKDRVAGPRDTAIWVMTAERYAETQAAQAEIRAFDLMDKQIALSSAYHEDSQTSKR